MKPLVVLEMANNHMGDPAHGAALVRAFADVVAPHRDTFDFAFKLQYRALDTYIHPDYRGRSDVKYVKRFEETRISTEGFRAMLAVMRACGFSTVCTPFDEPSVDAIEADGIDVIKIASCALTDWPLVERVARSDKPVVASTAGSSLEEIDAAVSFFLHRGKSLTLMHCVAEYPTPDERLAIEQVRLLAKRYPEARIGFSTHERPDHTEAVMLALAVGATVFEKHVGLPTETQPNNAYSASPSQLAAWLAAAARAKSMLGGTERYEPTQAEREGLHSLRRGLFVNRDCEAGTHLTEKDVFFAFPTVPGQVVANEWSKYYTHTLREPLRANAPVLHSAVDSLNQRARVTAAVASVKELLRRANVVVPGKSELEISHHYGMERFDTVGLTMVTVVNRAYCKKVLVMLPGQRHPEQFHERKEETFVVLFGSMRLSLDGEEQTVRAGDVVTVERGVRHEFITDEGVVFEEISSSHFTDDSFYTDETIAKNPARKTFLTHWL